MAAKKVTQEELKKETRSMVATFELEKETKNTFKFSETSKAPIIGTLYVQKLAFQGETPTEIEVEVKF